MGVSHFLEHMVFKGSETRGPIEVSGELDDLGLAVHSGDGLETTDDHARVVDDPLDLQEEVVCAVQFFSRHGLLSSLSVPEAGGKASGGLKQSMGGYSSMRPPPSH